MIEEGIAEGTRVVVSVSGAVLRGVVSDARGRLIRLTDAGITTGLGRPEERSRHTARVLVPWSAVQFVEEEL